MKNQNTYLIQPKKLVQNQPIYTKDQISKDSLYNNLNILLSMSLPNFSSQQSALSFAQQTIQKILSDKSFTNPQKLSLLLQEYQQRQQKLDLQLSTSLSQQISAIKQSKSSINQANQIMRQANQKTQQLKKIYNEQEQFNQAMEHVYMLTTVAGNLKKVIEQLQYFVDMDGQLSMLQKMSQDESKYMAVNQKLMNLIELRNALLQDSTYQRQNQLMKKQFIKVDNLEISFYDKIFSCFSDLLKYAKANPQSVSNSVKVIQAYDKALQLKGKPKVMRDRAIVTIKDSIDNKFLDKLSNIDQLIEIIQNAKFAMTDLIQIGDYVAPLFPKQFPVMDIFQNQYKNNIEKFIVPYFDQISQESQYGNLVVLLGWIDDYETMLSRAGLDSTNLVALKSKVKIMMPFFIDHNRQLVADYIANCLNEDQKNYCRKFYEETLMEGSDLVSFFPSDIFRFINQEADIMQDKLKGEVFVEFVRCITEELNDFQQTKANQILEDLQTIKQSENDDKIVDFEYLLILFLNNYNECLKHAGQSKQIFAQHVTEDYKNRIQKIFMNEVQKQFNASIPRFIRGIIEIIFLKVVNEVFPLFFTSKWMNDNSRQMITNVKNTITTELSDIQSQSLIINPIHYRMLVKDSLEYFVDAYVEQLIVFIRVVYNLPLRQGEMKMVNKSQTQKRLRQDPSLYESVMNSKSSFSQTIKKDKHIFLKLLETFNESTSKQLTTKLTNKFTLLSDLFIKKKGEFQQLLNKVAELFPQRASELIQAVLIVRDDVESRQSVVKEKKGMGIDWKEYNNM